MAVDGNDDTLEIKVPSRWAKLIVPLIAAALGTAGGGAAGTWLAPQASAQSIDQAATKAATEAARDAVSQERRVTDERFKSVDQKLETQSKQLDRIERKSDQRDEVLMDILHEVKK